MKKEDSKILNQLGKDAGFKVPDNFFATFNEQLEQSLPEVKITPEEKPSLWIKIRPLVYMAAMFAGVWLMMHIFSLGETSASKEQKAAQISDGLQVEKNADEFLNFGGVSDFDITYEDSVYNESQE